MLIFHCRIRLFLHPSLLLGLQPLYTSCRSNSFPLVLERQARAMQTPLASMIKIGLKTNSFRLSNSAAQQLLKPVGHHPQLQQQTPQLTTCATGSWEQLKETGCRWLFLLMEVMESQRVSFHHSPLHAVTVPTRSFKDSRLINLAVRRLMRQQMNSSVNEKQ